MKTYASFTRCYYDLLDTVYHNYEFECAPRGQKIRECLHVSFEITDPRNRLLYIPERDFSLSYAVAELVWYLIGNNETEWISTYSSFWKNISDDGKTANSAYGHRIFNPHDKMIGIISQWDYVKEELKRDPDSRRAVIHIRVPDDSANAKLDMPCTLTIQYFIRNGRLFSLVNMRSTDLIFGLSYDVPAFTFFQELLAQELGVGLGTYMHTSNSLHVYEKHFDMCAKMLFNPKHDAANGLEMPAIPEYASAHASYLDELQWKARRCNDGEQLVRLHDDLNKFSDPFWSDWGKILVSHRAGKLGLPSVQQSLIKSTSFKGYHQFSK